MSDTSTLFELLAAEPRRRILLGLCDADPIQVPEGIRSPDLARAERLSTQLLQKPPDHADSEQTLLVQLYHNHLPKLETEGYVEWDRDAQTVRKGPNFEEIEPTLRLLEANAEKLPGTLH